MPKAEYVPTIIRRDDPSIIPILYVSISLLLCSGGGKLAPHRFIFFVPITVILKHDCDLEKLKGKGWVYAGPRFGIWHSFWGAQV